MKKKSPPWLAVAAIIVIIFGTIYAVGRQIQRSDANWPQVQQVEEITRQLDTGVSPSSLGFGQVDLAYSLAPFVIIYDKNGKPVDGSGYLEGRLAEIPVGVLKAADGQTYNAVTWQPKDKVRIAAVAREAKQYYVVGGRSLAEVEKNTNQTLMLASLGGILALLVLGFTYRPSRLQ